MKEAFRKDQWFYVPYLGLAFAVGIVLLTYSKEAIHLWLNQHQPGWMDQFFREITNLGDGIFLPVCILILIFFSFRYSILVVASFLLSGLVVQVLKHTIFKDFQRPVAYMEKIHHLRFIEGVQQLHYNSFPSGHSASAFVFFLCFAMIIKQNHYKFAMLVCAVMVAYSRVYLSQHFLVDILGGSLIGICMTYSCNIWLGKYEKHWFNDNLITISRKK